MSQQIPVVTFFWAYSVPSKIHAIWVVTRVDQKVYQLVSRVLDLALSVKKYAGEWILDHLKSDYIDRPVPDDKFWALKVDFFLDVESGNVMSKTFGVNQTEDPVALELKKRVIRVLDIIQTEKVGMENE